ncbi:MAG TPA: hypothetical protein VKO20_00230 [Desulfosalsimonadaceae bacterium]|nr:hypothetical protein [Desulfosalsimonadaceae bacterium]
MKLDLRRHCIETEMKRQYNKALSQYFKAATDAERQPLETRIEMLQKGLENFDFNHLRAGYPELRGDMEAEITLAAQQDNPPLILINGERIDAY